MKYKITILILLTALVAGAAHAIDPEKEAMKPDDHRAGWLAGHQDTAKADESSCKGCHKQFFCIDCHQRRDTIQQRMHRRNYMFYHSIEARANPRKCDECHKPAYCTDCHRNPQQAGW